MLQQVLGPFQGAFSEVVARRVDGSCVQRLMAASFEHAPITALETPGEAAAGLLALVARYVQLAGRIYEIWKEVLGRGDIARTTTCSRSAGTR